MSADFFRYLWNNVSSVKASLTCRGSTDKGEKAA